jgi:hypothetical protein
MNLIRVAFKIAFEDKIPGGKADKRDPSQFDPISLRKGLLIELEHTDDLGLALEIAMDHLTEDERYYDALEVTEKLLEVTRPKLKDIASKIV